MTDSVEKPRVMVRVLSEPQVMYVPSRAPEINVVAELIDSNAYRFGGDFESRFHAVVLHSTENGIPEVGTEVEVTVFKDWYIDQTNHIMRLVYVD